MKLLIQNGRVLDPVSKTVTLTDLLAENGRVALLERGLETEADRIIDASGLVVSPGLVDMHVHLRDPGYTYKEDIRTGTAAAARGGVTSLACMANTDPVLDCPEQLHYVRERAKEGSGVHVYPIAAVSVGLRGEEPTDAEALKKAGAVALSDDGCNVDNANRMRDAMIRAKRQELPVLCHCEDTSMVEGRAVNEGSVSRQLWLEGRPAIAEELEVMRAAMLEAKRLGKLIVAHCEDNALLRGGYIHDGPYARAHGHRGICSESEWGPIARDLELVRETGCGYHVCHISTKESVMLIRKAKAEGLNVTCETGPHYLLLDESDLQEDGRFKMNPPLRERADVADLSLTEANAARGHRRRDDRHDRNRPRAPQRRGEEPRP